MIGRGRIATSSREFDHGNGRGPTYRFNWPHEASQECSRLKDNVTGEQTLYGLAQAMQSSDLKEGAMQVCVGKASRLDLMGGIFVHDPH